MPARLRLSWGMKTLKLFLLPVLDSLEFGWQVIRYALTFVSVVFRQRASLGCEMVAIRSQLTFYEESIRQKRQPRPRFHPAFRLLWVLLSSVWTGWKSAAELMKPKTVLKWHEHAFLSWWRWKSRRKGGRPTISQEMRALIRRLSLENVLWSAETIHGHLVLLGFDPPCPDTIRKYMPKPRGGTDKSQTWLTFLRNHLPVSWAMDFFTVPTLRLQTLYIFVILPHKRAIAMALFPFRGHRIFTLVRAVTGGVGFRGVDWGCGGDQETARTEAENRPRGRPTRAEVASGESLSSNLDTESGES
jgi:hypothetical protein